MRLGVVVDGPMRHTDELLEDWRGRFEVEVFAPSTGGFPLASHERPGARLLRELRELLERNDAVFFDWSTRLLEAASRMRTRARLVARLHSYELFMHAADVRWNAVDRVVFVSEAMRGKFVDMFPEHRERTRVVHCGKDLEVFRPVPRCFEGRLGMLCQIVPIKRVYEVVLAVYDLRRDGYDVSLHVGGEPRGGHDYKRYDASIRRAVEKLSLRDHVVFHGWVGDVVPWLQRIDVFVSNSYWEGQQNALLEAMGTGCYCLSHFWDGADEILPERYLFATDTEMRRKIATYCDLPDAEKYRHQAEYRAILEAKFDLRHARARMREVVAGCW